MRGGYVRRVRSPPYHRVPYFGSISTCTLQQDSQKRYLAATTQAPAELEGIPIERLRNFGISAHVDSGKTTLTERILFYTGMIDAIHEIQGSDGIGAKMDSMELERERGITIQSASTYTNWDYNGFRHHFNIIDTPGHVDFQIEVERALRVLDGAVLVVCGLHGVQSQTYSIDRQMKRYSIPRICFINKLDRELADGWRTVEMLRTKLKMNLVPIQVPMGIGHHFRGVVDVIERKAYEYKGNYGEKREEIAVPEVYRTQVDDIRSELIETLADVDDQFGDIYLEKGENNCTVDEIRNGLRRMTTQRKLVPGLFGSARKNKGVQDVLDAVCLYLPHAGERPVEAFRASDESVAVPIHIDARMKLVAMAFKIQDVEGSGTLTYIKVYQGAIRRGIPIMNVKNRKKIQWKKMFRMHSDDAEEIKVARAGDIVALSGIEVSSGTTLCDESLDVTLSSMFVPNTVISMAVSVACSADAAKFSKAVTRFQREDPTFKVIMDEESKQYLMMGMGELHLEIYAERMRREYGINLKLGSPKVNLREIITQKHEFTFTHKRQHGGRGEWARISGYFEPIDRERRTLPQCEFVNDQDGCGVPPNFIMSLKKSFSQITQDGPLTGYQILNLRFVLKDGETHEIDSHDQAFKNCMKKAFLEHYPNCIPAVLEPVMKVEIVVPTEYAPAVQSNVGTRQVLITNVKKEIDFTVFDADAPLRCMFGFIMDLRKMSKGQGEFSMNFSHYQILQGPELQKAIDDHKENKLKKHNDTD